MLSFSAFICLGIGGLVVGAERRPAVAGVVAGGGPVPGGDVLQRGEILIAKPGTRESADPLVPFLVVGGAFGFAIAAMLVPLLSEFDVALGRTAANDE